MEQTQIVINKWTFKWQETDINVRNNQGYRLMHVRYVNAPITSQWGMIFLTICTLYRLQCQGIFSTACTFSDI